MIGSTNPDEVVCGSFLLDVMCGTLAVYLRMCGYDAAYAGDCDIVDDEKLLEWARTDSRCLLTRDVELAGRAERGVLLETLDVEDQLAELAAFGVELELADPPTRCGRCNGRLDTVEPTADTPAYAPDPSETECLRCRDCGQYFWKGSHWNRVRATLDELDADRIDSSEKGH